MADTIIDKTGKVIANLHRLKFDPASNAYVGDIEFIAAPLELQQLLSRLEELVEDQTLARAEEIQSKIDDFSLSASLGDGSRHAIRDLYVNKDNGCSFRIAT